MLRDVPVCSRATTVVKRCGGTSTPYFETAQAHGAGFMLEANTWRANPAWGAQLGYSLDDLADANRRCVAFAEEIRAAEQERGLPIVISAPFGPEGDAYDPADHLSAEQAQEYHAWQAGVIADTAADLITGLTMTYVEEAIGIARAATDVGMPVVISFTVETDGRLPSGQALAEAIEQVDRETNAAPAYFMINCAHPTHFLAVLDGPGPWHRIRGHPRERVDDESRRARQRGGARRRRSC